MVQRKRLTVRGLNKPWGGLLAIFRAEQGESRHEQREQPVTPLSSNEVATSLSRGINWRGPFVMGLAGVILVVGITPFAVQAMGAAGNSFCSSGYR